MLEIGGILFIGGCFGAIANIVTSNYTKKAKDNKLKEEITIRQMERIIVEDEFKNILKQKDEEINRLKNSQSREIEIEEI